MTEAALLRALKDACRSMEGGIGMRVEEIQEATGRCPKVIRRELGKLIREGKVGRGTRYITRLDGRVTPVAGYYVVSTKG